MTEPQPARRRDAAIEVSDLHKYFGDNEVLKGIDFQVDHGEVVCVIGPSGSGKSTLLRCVNLLEEPTSGKIFVEGIEITDPDVDIDKVRRRIGMVFQQFNLFPHLTRAAEPDDRAAAASASAARTEADRDRRARTSSGSGSPTRATPTRPSSPAVSSSASRSPGRCRWTRT